MPNTSLSNAIKEAYSSAPTDAVILHTLEFRHELFSQPIRVILDNRDWTARLENSAPLNGGEFVNFVAFVFDVTLPNLEESASPQLKIEMDNVTQVIQEQLQVASISDSLTEVTYRPYLSSNVDGNGRLQSPEMDPPINLNVDSVSVTPLKITAIASFSDLGNKTFPTEEYNTTRFPGLLR